MANEIEHICDNHRQTAESDISCAAVPVQYLSNRGNLGLLPIGEPRSFDTNPVIERSQFSFLVLGQLGNQLPLAKLIPLLEQVQVPLILSESSQQGCCAPIEAHNKFTV